MNNKIEITPVILRGLNKEVGKILSKKQARLYFLQKIEEEKNNFDYNNKALAYMQQNQIVSLAAKKIKQQEMLQAEGVMKKMALGKLNTLSKKGLRVTTKIIPKLMVTSIISTWLFS